MYCASCGTPLTQGLSYCNRCGANLREHKETKVGAISAFLTAITLIGVAGLGIMLGGALVLRKEAGLGQELVGVFMLFTFLIVAHDGIHAGQKSVEADRLNRTNKILARTTRRAAGFALAARARLSVNPFQALLKTPLAPSSTHGANNKEDPMRKVALLLLISLLVSGCHHGMIGQLKGSGNRQTQKREIAPSLQSRLKVLSQSKLFVRRT